MKYVKESSEEEEFEPEVKVPKRPKSERKTPSGRNVVYEESEEEERPGKIPRNVNKKKS